MRIQWLLVVTIVAAVGAGLVAGAFFAFSTFVMRALDRLPAHEGIAAMQSINIVVINPLFMGAFMGTALVCVAALIGAVMHRAEPGMAFVIAGAALYLIGTFLVTVACNVPLNDALAPLSPTAPNAAAHWTDYVQRWTLWNHVRTIAATASLAAFLLALLQSSARP